MRDFDLSTHDRVDDDVLFLIAKALAVVNNRQDIVLVDSVACREEFAGMLDSRRNTRE